MYGSYWVFIFIIYCLVGWKINIILWIFGFNKIVYYGYDLFYLFDEGREVCIFLYKILIFVEYIN